MRRQTALTGALIVEEAVRLDPRALPALFTVRLAAGEGGLAGADIHTDRSEAVVTRRHMGQRHQTCVALADYRGVAARVALGDVPGEVIVTLELLHRDPALSLVLMEADDLEDVVADWQAWARRLALPLMMIEPDGTVRDVAQAPNRVRVGRPGPRRRSCVLRGRRPRFLIRRKAGSAGAMAMHGDEREIIARN